MKEVLDPDLLYVVEAKGQPIGMSLSLPDLCDPLRRAYPKPGTPELWTLAKFMFNYKVRKTQKYVRVLIMGVLPEYRLSGIDALLMATTADAAMKKGYTSARPRGFWRTTCPCGRGWKTSAGKFTRPIGFLRRRCNAVHIA